MNKRKFGIIEIKLSCKEDKLKREFKMGGPFSVRTLLFAIADLAQVIGEVSKTLDDNFKKEKDEFTPSKTD